MTSTSKSIYSQLEEVINKLDDMIKENKKLNNIIKDLEEIIKNLEAQHLKDIEQNEKLIKEIERLKINNNKNSNNSSKPSSTNGFKKVILNNREKSDRKKGGQKNHKGKTLTKEDIDKMIENGEIDKVEEIIENKNEFTKNNKPIITYEIDIEISKKVIKHIYYPEKQNNIKSSPVYYGNNIKTIANLLSMKYLSLDAITEILKELTNGIIKLSKATIYEWNKTIGKILEEKEYNTIKSEIVKSLILNVDETPIVIDGATYYIHNVSNDKYTFQYVHKNRGKVAVESQNLLPEFNGILVHDHFNMYYNYGIDNGECNVHITRYLKAVTEYTKHTWAKEMQDFLLNAKKHKEELMNKGIQTLTSEEYTKYKNNYFEILKKGNEEYKNDHKKNAYAKEEKSLLNRLEKYSHNHLLFLEKFYVPFSNNRAEADLRTVKIRQKIGKFRSLEGANIYAITRSCFSTFKKNNINYFQKINNLLANN